MTRRWLIGGVGRNRYATGRPTKSNTMTVAADGSISVATDLSDDHTVGARNASQRLTREQFEAAMRVMDAHVMPRSAAASPEVLPVATAMN